MPQFEIRAPASSGERVKRRAVALVCRVPRGCLPYRSSRLIHRHLTREIRIRLFEAEHIAPYGAIDWTRHTVHCRISASLHGPLDPCPLLLQVERTRRGNVVDEGRRRCVSAAWCRAH